MGVRSPGRVAVEVRLPGLRFLKTMRRVHAHVPRYFPRTDAIGAGIDQSSEAKRLVHRTPDLRLELSRFLRQPVKTQNPSNGELSHGIVS